MVRIRQSRKMAQVGQTLVRRTGGTKPGCIASPCVELSNVNQFWRMRRRRSSAYAAQAVRLHIATIASVGARRSSCARLSPGCSVAIGLLTPRTLRGKERSLEQVSPRSGRRKNGPPQRHMCAGVPPCCHLVGKDRVGCAPRPAEAHTRTQPQTPDGRGLPRCHLVGKDRLRCPARPETAHPHPSAEPRAGGKVSVCKPRPSAWGSGALPNPGGGGVAGSGVSAASSAHGDGGTSSALISRVGRETYMTGTPDIKLHVLVRPHAVHRSTRPCANASSWFWTSDPPTLPLQQDYEAAHR